MFIYTREKGAWILNNLLLWSPQGQGHMGKESKAQIIITLFVLPLYIWLLLMLQWAFIYLYKSI